MTPLQLTSAITAFGNAIACNLTTAEISLLSAIFVNLGDVLASIAAQRDLCKQEEN